MNKEKYGQCGFQKGHKFYKGGEKGWFTTERCKGNINGFQKGKTIYDLVGYKKGKEALDKGHKKHIGMKYPSMSGDKHFNWRGGVTFEEYPKEFFTIRNDIFERDNYTCQLCGDKFIKGKHNNKKCIGVHHIDYNKKNNKSDNLIALCNFCNSSVNFKRNEWISFFQNKITCIHKQEVVNEQ